MADIRTFAAVMPPPEKAKAVADPPYDVVSTEEARQLASDNPFGFMKVARAEVSWSEPVDPYSDEVYAKARENYEKLRRTVPLHQDSRPSYYVYSLEMNGHRQHGVVAAAAVDDYDRNVIRKHEKTRQDKEDDRTRHILALRSQTGPVFLTYRDADAVDALVAKTMDTDPLFDFRAADGVRHSGWRVPQSLNNALCEAFAQVPALYIADGHHRAASASRARATLRRADGDPSEPQEYDGFLSVIFPASQLQILPYNRVVESLNGLTAEEFLSEVCATPFEVSPCDGGRPVRAGDVHLYLGERWLRLRWSGGTDDLSPVDRLDVSLLQDHVLGPILGIDDPRTSKRIDFVGGIRGTDELVRRVRSGEGAVAFSMVPTTVSQLMAISDADQIMPPKSTWFEPKLRDGLFVHDI